MRNAESEMRNAERGTQFAEELGQDDELLLQQFFAENTAEIPDNGFSRQVMRRLPERNIRRTNNIWAAACWLGGLVLFLLFDGVATVRNGIINLLGNIYGFLVTMNLSTILQSINFSMLATTMAVLLVLSVVAVYNKLEQNI